MHHFIHKIKAFRLAGDYTIEIIFEDNTQKIIDFSPVLYGEVYSPLKNPDYFNKVFLDKEVYTIVWPNGADFDPSLLYNWDQHIRELSIRAKEWGIKEYN